MVPRDLKESLIEMTAAAEHPRELAIDVMFALQDHYGYLSDEAVAEAAEILRLSSLEVEELATFYTFLYREPVGRYVIHVCDSVVCWMQGQESLAEHLSRKLGIRMGETTAEGLFTLLPVCCIGYCDRAPAILINRKLYGPLTPEKLDEILERLKRDADESE
ncbi:MAG TPA: NADH-quinone oxidoreductase subunit NuoE [Syntrophobacteria bacterium]|nr:NADH-quinone oxidoreductase subunit NuoE [Syntrophobacteria bacterium]